MVLKNFDDSEVKERDDSLVDFIKIFTRKRKLEDLLEIPPKTYISIKPQAAASLICGSNNGLFM